MSRASRVNPSTSHENLSVLSYLAGRRPLLRGLLTGSVLVLSIQAALANTSTTDDPPSATAPGESPPPPAEAKIKQLSTISVRAPTKKPANFVPTSSTRIDGSQLENAQVHTLDDLQQLAPELTVTTVDTFNTALTIRGIGDGGGEASGDVNIGMPSSVALYLDNVYLSRTGMMSRDLEDIDYVQVFSGALGTAFAANATGGVVDIHTRAPDATPEGELKIGVGQRGYGYAKAMFSGALSNHWNGRIDVYHSRTNGYIHNAYDGRTLGGSYRSGVRAQTVYSRSPFFDLRLIADYSRENSRPTGVLMATHTIDGVNIFANHAAALGITPYVGKRSVDIDDVNSTHSQQAGTSAEANWHFSNGYHLSSVSSFRYFRYKPTSADVLSVPIYADSGTRVADRTWSTALRLESPHGDLFDYTAGVDYYGEKLRTVADTFYSDLAGSWYGASSYNNLHVLRYGQLNEARFSAFVQGTWHLADRWDLTAAGRETHDRKGASFVRYNKAPFNSGYLVQTSHLPAGQVALNYAVTPTTRAYIAFSYGEKSGAVNVSAGAASKAGYGSLFLKPETTKSAEIGIRGSSHDDFASFKADIFFTKVEDFQTQGFDPATLQTYLLNAGSFRSRGAEASLQLKPSSHWDLQFSAVYNDETYLDYANARCPPEQSLSANPPTSCNLTGRRVFNAPRLTGNLGARYGWRTAGGSDAYISGRYSYRSWMYSTVDDSSFARIPSYGLLSFSAGLSRNLKHGTLSTSLWVNNALNKLYYRRLVNSDYGAVVGYPGEPRTVGVTVDYSF